jgi:hypothetical protein
MARLSDEEFRAWCQHNQLAPDGELALDVSHTTQVVQEVQGPTTLDPDPLLVVRKPESSPQAIRTVTD